MSEFSYTLIIVALVLVIVTIIAVLIIINSGKQKKEETKNSGFSSGGHNNFEKSKLPNKGLIETKPVKVNNSGNSIDLEAELEKLKSQKNKTPERAATTNTKNRFIKEPLETEEQPVYQKVAKTSSNRKFLPLDETQDFEVNRPSAPRKSDIPDTMFKQSTVPEKGVLAIPYRIADFAGVIGSVLFDSSGLPVSHATKKDIRKEILSAYSTESIRIIKKLINAPESETAWFNAMIGKYAILVIMKDGMGCTILLDKNTDILHISNLAKSVIEELTTYIPKEYA